MELQPAAAVSLLDTDLEADVTPSAEFMARIEAEQAAARAAEAERTRLEAEESRRRRDVAEVRHACPSCGLVVWRWGGPLAARPMRVLQ